MRICVYIICSTCMCLLSGVPMRFCVSISKCKLNGCVFCCRKSLIAIIWVWVRQRAILAHTHTLSHLYAFWRSLFELYGKYNKYFTIDEVYAFRAMYKIHLSSNLFLCSLVSFFFLFFIFVFFFPFIFLCYSMVVFFGNCTQFYFDYEVSNPSKAFLQPLVFLSLCVTSSMGIYPWKYHSRLFA